MHTHAGVWSYEQVAGAESSGGAQASVLALALHIFNEAEVPRVVQEAVAAAASATAAAAVAAAPDPSGIASTAAGDAAAGGAAGPVQQGGEGEAGGSSQPQHEGAAAVGAGAAVAQPAPAPPAVKKKPAALPRLSDRSEQKLVQTAVHAALQVCVCVLYVCVCVLYVCVRACSCASAAPGPFAETVRDSHPLPPSQMLLAPTA